MATPLALVTFLLDRSGSMQDHVESTCKAFNAYVETLKKTKGAQIRFSVVQFGNGLERMTQWDSPVQDAVKLSGENYSPESGTMLYASLLQLIPKIEAEVSKRPQKVVVCIQTDGASCATYCTRSEARGSGDDWGAAGDLVRKKMREGWEFVFMALESDPRYREIFKKTALEHLGIPRANLLIYGPDSRETEKAFSDTAWNVGAFSSGRADTAAYTEEQRKARK